MRIVIDLQGAQAANAQRGIGRYTRSLVQGILEAPRGHEIFLVLNDGLPDSVRPLRQLYGGLLPQERILVWRAPGPCADVDPENRWRRNAAEALREAFIAELQPDAVLVTSLFEGIGDEAVVGIGSFRSDLPTAVLLYDLIPALFPDQYLARPEQHAWYLRQLDHLRRADRWLAISEATRTDAIRHLGLDTDRVTNVSAAADGVFDAEPLDPEAGAALRQRYGLARPFVLNTGGIDPRKNLPALIRAFSRLPERNRYHLVIVCQASDEDVRDLRRIAAQSGLSREALVVTGYIPEQDLAGLYKLCVLFVFPSLYEGFGLPALEAMRCGAPVIAADRASLPEVVGHADALFNPDDPDAIAAAMGRVLGDPELRDDLRNHGLRQSRGFSWRRTADAALDVLEGLHQGRRRPDGGARRAAPSRRPRLAYVSPLPAERSGIADYSAELLPELTRYYNVEVVVAQEAVTDPWINACLPVRDVDSFRRDHRLFDRVLYHMGNSGFHLHMFGLMHEIPGTVVLHDFFLGGVQSQRPGWAETLCRDHGYRAQHELEHEPTHDFGFKYPCNLSLLQQARGVIVHSEHARSLAAAWYGPGASAVVDVIPLPRRPAAHRPREQARARLGLSESDFLVCSFGLLGVTKLNRELLAAWLESALCRDAQCRLVFVGENDPWSYGRDLAGLIARAGSGRVKITGWVDVETYRDYLAAADLAVQLRTRTRGETSAAVLDALNHGLPTVINANGALSELPADVVCRLPDSFTSGELAEALDTLWRDATRRADLGVRGRAHVRSRHDPAACAALYADAIESAWHRGPAEVSALIRHLVDLPGAPAGGAADWPEIAAALGDNHPPAPAPRALYVDISELVQRDARSGIQRVVRALLQQMLLSPPPGWRVEPVYADVQGAGYRLARRYTRGFLGLSGLGADDEPLAARAGDLFLGLDLQPDVVPAQADTLARLHRRGVRVHFVVYDLLPLQLPHAYPAGFNDAFERWLDTVSAFDALHCISGSVAVDLRDWLRTRHPQRVRSLTVNSFVLGADIECSQPTTGLPPNMEQLDAALAARPHFLAVGTIEPRKAYGQLLDALEILWSEGLDAGLCIVGRHGWMVDDLISRLRTHRELNRRLFWFAHASDELLEHLYRRTHCLVLPSEGEGFGLPLVEAALRDLPIIARDLPVFREICADNAFFFSGMGGTALANALREWLTSHQRGCVPPKSGIAVHSWADSAQSLRTALGIPAEPMQERPAARPGNRHRSC